MKAPVISENRTVLNQVLNAQRFSLPNYLRYARPWARETDHLLLAVVFGIAEAQTQNANRIGELLIERHANVEPGTFPKRFTGLNDVSIRYAAPRVVEDLERIIGILRFCTEDLCDDPIALDLVRSILRDEQRHLQILNDELHHAQHTLRLEPQWMFEHNGDGSVERDAARQWSGAKITEVPQPA